MRYPTRICIVVSSPRCSRNTRLQLHFKFICVEHTVVEVGARNHRKDTFVTLLLPTPYGLRSMPYKQPTHPPPWIHPNRTTKQYTHRPRPHGPSIPMFPHPIPVYNPQPIRRPNPSLRPFQCAKTDLNIVTKSGCSLSNCSIGGFNGSPAFRLSFSAVLALRLRSASMGSAISSSSSLSSSSSSSPSSSSSRS